MPKVWNKRNNPPEEAVYVGRPSRWGNPFVAPGTQSKLDVTVAADPIKAYEEYLRQDPLLLKDVKRELKGKDLVCWCAPRRCHADVLLKIANEE